MGGACAATRRTTIGGSVRVVTAVTMVASVKASLIGAARTVSRAAIEVRAQTRLTTTPGSARVVTAVTMVTNVRPFETGA